MDFKEYLSSLGIEEKTVNSIVDGMPKNNLYIASEDNLDTRFSKIKEQKEQLESDLNTANNLVSELQKTVKNNEGATSKIEQYQKEAEEAKAARAETEKTYAIKDALREAGATDVEYMMFKLGDIEMADDGTVKDLDNKIKGLQESNADWFKSSGNKPDGSDGGYKPIDSKLEDGNPADPETAAQAAFEAAVGIQS